MEILDKTQMAQQFGVFGSRDNPGQQILLAEIKYLGGFEPLDKRISYNAGGSPVFLKTHPKGLEIQVLHGFSKTRLCVFYEEINYWVIEPQSQIVGAKGKSIVGRALVGGLLLGPIGAVIGGMTGLGTKEIKLNEIDNIVTLSCKAKNQDEQIILFSAKNEVVAQVDSFLKENFPINFKTPKELEFISQTAEVPSFSIADELLKFKQLLDSGLLTQEEFEQQKKKLLSL